MMFRLNVPTRRGVVLNGVLFRLQEERKADTVMIAITGIHGNFYSNPFYYNIGDTLNSGGFDFIYAQTNDAFSQIETVNVKTGRKEIIGSWNERFSYTDEDIDAYLTFAEQEGFSSTFCHWQWQIFGIWHRVISHLDDGDNRFERNKRNIIDLT